MLSGAIAVRGPGNEEGVLVYPSSKTHERAMMRPRLTQEAGLGTAKKLSPHATSLIHLIVVALNFDYSRSLSNQNREDQVTHETGGLNRSLLVLVSPRRPHLFPALGLPNGPRTMSQRWADAPFGTTLGH